MAPGTATARRFVCPSAHDVDRLSSGVRRGWGEREGGDDSPAPCPRTDRSLCFPSRAFPVAPSPGRFATFWARHCPLCRSFDWVPSSAGNNVGDWLAITPPRLRVPAGNPTPITPVKGRPTYSGEIESLDRDLGIETLDPGIRFPGN